MNIIVYSANSNSGETPIKLLPIDFIMPSQEKEIVGRCFWSPCDDESCGAAASHYARGRDDDLGDGIKILNFVTASRMKVRTRLPRRRLVEKRRWSGSEPRQPLECGRGLVAKRQFQIIILAAVARSSRAVAAHDAMIAVLLPPSHPPPPPPSSLFQPQ